MGTCKGKFMYPFLRVFIFESRMWCPDQQPRHSRELVRNVNS